MSLGDEPGYGDGPRGEDGGYGGSGQTRTRLPDRPGDVYGGARRGRGSSSRSLVTVVGVVVLLIAAIAFANRGDDAASPGDSSGDKAKTSPTAASGHPPVTSKTAGDPIGLRPHGRGSTERCRELRGRAGLHRHVQRRPAARDRRRRVHARGGSRTAARPGLGLHERDVPDEHRPGQERRRSRGQTFISRIIPVGTKIKASSTDGATVELWYTSLFGLSGDSSTNPVSESWYTTTYQLKWINGDWKVTDFTQKDGPVPVGRDQKASTADDMTKAVEEYGGFTYAR